MGFKMKNPPYKTHSKKVPFSNEHLYGGDDDTGGPYGMHPSDWKSPERIKKEKKKNNKKKKK
jgi:hypothetical protein|tara:strand:- start:58 stop:243 length:186 start_codon:yes stop_codon:yes gene_type:complete